jgi:hypothetical protein
MCTKYKVCGYNHLPGWKVSKLRRDRKGRFDKDRRLWKGFIYLNIAGFLVVMSMVGVNNLIDWFKSLEKVFVVEKTYAEEVIVITWQDEVKGLLRDAGIDIEFATRLIQCESSWNPDAFHYNRNSVDRGLWQLNSYFYPVDKSCAYDAICSTRKAIEIIKSRGFQEWSCVSKGLIK